MQIEENVRCGRCDALLAEVITRPWRIRCRKCKGSNVGRIDAPLTGKGAIAPDGPHALKSSAKRAANDQARRMPKKGKRRARGCAPQLNLS